MQRILNTKKRFLFAWLLHLSQFHGCYTCHNFNQQFRRNHAALCALQSALCAPQSALCAPQSAITRNGSNNTTDGFKLALFLLEVESSRTSLASRTPRGHILKSLASKPQVLANCPVLARLEDSTIFEPLKFCWKRSETLRKICKDLFFGFLK